MVDLNQPLAFGASEKGAPGGADPRAVDGAVPVTDASGGKPAGGSRHGKAVYPTKTAINLVRQDKTRSMLLTELALFVIVVALIGVFGKFAVVDPLADGMSSSADVAAAQAHLDQLTAENADYAELDDTYARYIVTGLTEEELNLANRNELLDLIQANLMSVGYLSSLKVAGNVVSATSLGADLTAVSQLVETLEGDSRVAHVTVSTAQGTDNTTSATIEVTMKGALDFVSDELDEQIAFESDGAATAGANAVDADTAGIAAGKEAGNGAA